jgi:hypothetical protein
MNKGDRRDDTQTIIQSKISPFSSVASNISSQLRPANTEAFEHLTDSTSSPRVPPHTWQRLRLPADGSSEPLVSAAAAYESGCGTVFYIFYQKLLPLHTAIDLNNITPWSNKSGVTEAVAPHDSDEYVFK